MKKRICSVVLAITTAASLACVTSCGKKETKGDNEKTLTYWVGLDPNVATRVQSYNDVALYKEMEKRTGVHIDFIHPTIGQEAEQFKLLLASKDMPDIIEYSWSDYPGGVQKAIDDGVIIPLDDYMDKAPNFKKALTDGDLADVYRQGSTTSTGQHYGFTTLNTGNYRVFTGPVLRKDWLDELGLEVPQTIDDWTTVLTAFKEKKNVRYPLTGFAGYLCLGVNDSTFAGAYGVGNRVYVDNGSVKFGPLQDEYKDYITQLNKWYSAGLLDNDLANNQGTLIDSKIVNNEAGALINGYLGSGLGRYLTQKKGDNSGFDLVGAPYPVLNKGDINAFPIAENDVMPVRTIAITSSCKNPELAIEWCDYWYGEDGYYLLNFGVEGESYNMVDGKPVYTDTILKNPDGLSINEALLLYCRATSPAPGFKQAPEYLEQYYEFQQQVDALELWTENEALFRTTKFPTVDSTKEEGDIISSIRTDLYTYVDENIWEFVTGKRDISEYDKFREEIKKNFDIDSYLDVLQKQYDRYMNK